MGNKNSLIIKPKSMKHLVKISLFSFFFLVVAGEAFAQSGTTLSVSSSSNILVDTMCNALKIITGNAGKAFAAFAIISVGIGFFTGKVSWGLMIGVAAGIAAMFGAPSIVSAITGKSSFDCGA